MYRLVLHKSVTVSGVRRGRHITQVTPDRFWVADGDGNLILTNMAGDELRHITNINRGVRGAHTVTGDCYLIYIDSDRNVIKLSTDHKVKMIPYTSPWIPKCVYSSPSTGDLLVVMYRGDTDTSQVNRYTNTGEHIQTIEHDNTGQELYKYPIYITENRNGDVIVSDIGRYAVVVTDSRGRHRFSYTGPTSGSGLDPHGICTDALSHILVCDWYTQTVHILDCDGRLLSLIEIEQHGINRPLGLSYDDRTHCVWMGSDDNNTVNIHRLEHSLTEFLKKEETTVCHARGILVGCGEAGKTTLLKRLREQCQNRGEVKKSTKGLTTLLKRLRGKRQNVDEVTESTRGLEIHQHLFIVRDGILEAPLNHE
ncbi:uncharacterized protein LOC134237770 [Saccostrea cucullata]|uniref:uncharacterized protein LOC134237770 n=1 Tax=Saccostrea cuccullata TaxID=36930 RepID=UPI002ED1732E